MASVVDTSVLMRVREHLLREFWCWDQHCCHWGGDGHFQHLILVHPVQEGQ